MTDAPHLVDRIEALLRESAFPMTVPQICAALPVTVDDSIVANVMCTGKKLGQFQIHLLDGKASYSINARRIRTEASEAISVPAPGGEPDQPTAPSTMEAKTAPIVATEKVSFIEALRRVIRAGGKPMTLDMVCDALPEEQPDRGRTASLLSQRRQAGEFSVEVVEGKRAFSINPDYAKPAGKRSAVKKPLAAPKPKGEAEPTSVIAPTLAPAQTAATSRAQPTQPHHVKQSADAFALKGPFGFADRMTAIVEDLDGAVTDAVEMDLDKGVLAQLITATRLVNAALVATLRS